MKSFALKTLNRRFSVSIIGASGSNLADANDVVEMIDGDLGAGALSRPDPSGKAPVARSD